MITREEANQIYKEGNIQRQLAKLEEVIRKVAPKQKGLTLAISGFTREWMAEQNKLWPNFDGLLPETVEVFRESGFYIKEQEDILNNLHAWYIEW